MPKIWYFALMPKRMPINHNAHFRRKQFLRNYNKNGSNNKGKGDLAVIIILVVVIALFLILR